MKKVFLDPGHGGKDPGAVGNGIKEKDIVLAVGLKVGEILKRHKIEVFYSRTTDVFVELAERSNKANNISADVFVSIHCNKVENEQAQGLETYSHPSSKNGTALAKCIQDSILKDKLYTKDRGIKTANFSVLRNTKMTAALVELGFISNVEDANILKYKQDELAESVAKGVLNFLGIKYIDKKTDTKDNTTLHKVQVGAYSIKSNAERLLKDLEDKGFKGFIQEEKIKVEVVPKVKEYDYYEKHGLKVIETYPDNIYVSTLPGRNLRQFGVYGVNGSWQNTSDAQDPKSIWGLVANANGPIGPNSHQNSPNGHKRGTIIHYVDGTTEVKRINNIKEIDKPIKWAIGGGMLLPDYNPSIEKIASDILRYTHHTGVGYKGDKVFLIVTSSHCTLSEFKSRVEQFKLDGAVFLDGGGSTQMNWKDGKGLHSSRPLSHGVFIKGVK